MADDVKTEETPKRKPPVLMGKNLLIEVVCEPPAGSPFSPVTARVIPFTRMEWRKYIDALRPFVDKDTGRPLPDQIESYEAYRDKRFAERIKQWDILLAEGGPVAEINAGTVSMLPQFAFDQIDLALTGEAGKLVGNSDACSA